MYILIHRNSVLSNYVKQEGFLLLPDHFKVKSFVWLCFLQFRDGVRSENLSGQVVMQRAATSRQERPPSPSASATPASWTIFWSDVTLGKIFFGQRMCIHFCHTSQWFDNLVENSSVSCILLLIELHTLFAESGGWTQQIFHAELRAST